MKIADSVVCVVGGATGLGKVLCEQLLVKGARVLCIDSDDKAVAAVRALWTPAHKPKLWCGTCTDLTSETALLTLLTTEALRAPVARGGLLHALINVTPSANGRAPALDVDGLLDVPSKWRRVVDSELTAAIEATRVTLMTMRAAPVGTATPTSPKAVAPAAPGAPVPAGGKMACEGMGQLIHVLSLRDVLGDPKHPLVGAAAGAIVSMTRTLTSLAPAVRVNALCSDVGEEKAAFQSIVTMLEDAKMNGAALRNGKDGPVPIPTVAAAPAAISAAAAAPVAAAATAAAAPGGSPAHHHHHHTASSQHHTSSSHHHGHTHGREHSSSNAHPTGREHSGSTATREHASSRAAGPAPGANGAAGGAVLDDTAQILHALSKSKTIAGYLNESERAKMATCFKLQEYAKGDLMFKQGETGAGAFILAKGSVEVFLTSVDTKGHSIEQVINRYQPGDMWGEQALISAVKRLASVRAAVPSSLWVCTREEFQSKFGHKRMGGARAGVSAEAAPAATAKPVANGSSTPLSPVSAAAAAAGVGPKPKLPPIPQIPREKKKDERTIEFIGKAVERNLLFLDLTRAQKRAVIAEMWKVNVKAGERIIEQGANGDVFYVIDTGRFDITVNGMRVAMRRDGECFGELALMYNQPRAATVTASGACVVWAIDRATFRSTLAEINRQTLAQYDALLKKVEKVEILKTLSLEDRQKVVEAIEEVVKPAGSVLMFQGETKPANSSFSMYFLMEGKCHCTKYAPDGKSLEVDFEYGPGAHFGELALITDEPRKATIKCTTDCLLYALSGENFRGLVVGDSTSLGKQLAQQLSSYEPGGVHGAVSPRPASQSIVPPPPPPEKASPTNPPLPPNAAAGTLPPLPPGAVAGVPPLNIVSPNSAAAAAAATGVKAVVQEKEEPILFEDLVVKRMLGKGSFGTVKLVVHKHTGKAYALKSVWKKQIVDTGQQSHVMSEKKVMAQLKHPFLTRLHATYRDQHRLFFLLEVSLGGELFTVLRTRQAFDEPTARFYAATVVLAFEYMHSRDIIYRDLKPENLMMDEAGFLKVTDFGFAKVIPEGRTYTLCGTPDYLAPEIVSGKGHGKGVDWWTLGIFLFEMLASYPPFYDEDPMKTYQKIIAGKIAFPAHFGPEAKDLITHLLEPKASKRYGVVKGGADLIKLHPFFRGFDWHALVTRQMPPPIPRPIANAEDTQNFDQSLEMPDETPSPATAYIDDGSNWDAAF